MPMILFPQSIQVLMYIGTPMILIRRLTAYLFSGFIAFGLIPTPLGHTQSNRIKFWCASLDSEVRTMVRFPSGHEKIFLIWSTNVDGESREQQCQKSSPRFQRNQIGSEYRYMAAGTYGERQVICATEMQTSSIVDCDNDNILIFLRNDDDNESFLRALVEALKPGGLPANHSSLYGEDGEGRWIDAYRLLNFNIN
jgi:hypothetical protein